MMEKFQVLLLSFFALLSSLELRASGYSVKRRHSGGGVSLLFGQAKSAIEIDGCSGSVKLDNASIASNQLFTQLTQYFLVCSRSVCILELKFNPCLSAADSEAAKNTVADIAEHVSTLPRKPTGLILVNLPVSNAPMIEAMKRHLKSLEIAINNATEMRSGLAAVEQCHKITFLSVSGPYDPEDLLQAVDSKIHLSKLNLKQSSGAFDPDETAGILESIPDLKVVNFLCKDACTSNYSGLVAEASQKLSTLSGINLQTKSEPIDSAAVKLSETVRLPINLALVLTGNQSISCPNMAIVAKNLFLAETQSAQPFYLVILRVQQACESMSGLWRRVERSLSGSLSNCYVDGSLNCRRYNGREILVSNVQ